MYEYTFNPTVATITIATTATTIAINFPTFLLSTPFLLDASTGEPQTGQNVDPLSTSFPQLPQNI